MHLLSIIFVGFIANVDNLVIGFSYGIKQTKIPFSSNFIIALMSMICSFVALFTGHWLTDYLKPSIANTLGGSLLVIIGGLTIWSTFYERKKKFDESSSTVFQVMYEPKSADLDLNNTISLKESILLGFALALNSISTSFSVGLTDPSFIAYILSIGLFSVLSIWFGTKLGSRIKSFLKNLEIFAPVLSGIFLVLIGLYELIN